MTSKVVSARGMQMGLNRLYSFGAKRGSSTGWPTVDEHYTVVPGQLTVVTGWPGSGKSEFVDAMLVHLVKEDWRVAMFSPENWPVQVHVSKILEKWLGKPFGPGPTERMGYEEVVEATEDIGNRFGFIKSDESVTVAEVLERAEEYFDKVRETGINLGLVIDPWNELDHMRPANLTETEYISRTLSVVRNWARQQECHVWLVAHPAKQRRTDKGELPKATPDMIAGSQHWWNKADNCLMVYRDYENQNSEIELHVQKIRFKHIGKIGVVDLIYDKPTGRYFEPRRDSNGRAFFYSGTA